MVAKCLCCNKLTQNPKFCSRSCSAKITNKMIPKRKKKINYCSSCGNERLNRAKICTSCIDKKRHRHTTLDLSHKYRGNCIRSRARSIMKHIKSCASCGYMKHVEVCHIKPIKSFPQYSKIDTINDISNLIVLCPNCHWELDNINEDDEARTRNLRLDKPTL